MYTACVVKTGNLGQF